MTATVQTWPGRTVVGRRTSKPDPAATVRNFTDCSSAAADGAAGGANAAGAGTAPPGPRSTGAVSRAGSHPSGGGRGSVDTEIQPSSSDAA